MRVNGEALQLHSVYKKPYFYCKSHKNLYQYYKSCENPYKVLQVTRTASEHAMKWKVRMINHYHHSTKLYWKKYHSFVAVGIVCTLVTIQTATNL